MSDPHHLLPTDQEIAAALMMTLQKALKRDGADGIRILERSLDISWALFVVCISNGVRKIHAGGAPRDVAISFVQHLIDNTKKNIELCSAEQIYEEMLSAMEYAKKLAAAAGDLETLECNPLERPN